MRGNPDIPRIARPDTRRRDNGILCDDRMLSAMHVNPKTSPIHVSQCICHDKTLIDPYLTTPDDHRSTAIAAGVYQGSSSEG
jgi:hypothetical protein